MDKLNEITAQRKRAHARFVALQSKVYASFLEMERAAYADGALPKKHKELIAVGISVVKDCESCMQWHIEQAVAAGASLRKCSKPSRLRSRWEAAAPPCPRALRSR